MSGNPFRRSIHVNTTADPLDVDLSAAAERFPDIQDADHEPQPEPQPRKTKKTVRITSPPQSPPSPNPPADSSLARRATPARHSGSPPPSNVEDSSDSDTPTDDPFEKQSDSADESAQDEVLRRKRRQDSGKMASVNAQTIPQNPFQRTLASIEGSTVQQDLLRGAGSMPEQPGNSGGKGGMDVDSFKRLLLTGNTGSQTSASSATPSNTKPTLVHPVGDSSSSSTDTSSISRHSIFDPTFDAHLESPRTSYERSESDNEDHDEKSSLMGSEKKKPPPPKPRHGRPIGQRGPQTVSFTDFSPSISSPNPPQSPQRPGLSRAGSDLNKPLPPPPPFSTSPEQKASVPWPEAPQESPRLPNKEPTLSPGQGTDSTASPSQKKQPPPVPLARRHSQLRSNVQNRSRSNSSLTLPSQPEEAVEDEEPSPSPISTPPTTSKAPPPPPARRTAAVNKPSPSTAGIPNEPSPSPRPSRSGSNSSMQRPHRTSNASSISGQPPPPPPPRKTSGRTSLDGRRSSVISASEFQERGVDPRTPTVMAPPAEDVMKSMDDFQKEVDALIAKAGK